MTLLLKRKTCQNSECKKEVVHLINDMYCSTCYHAKYYKDKTKKKIKRKKKEKKVWWMQY